MLLLSNHMLIFIPHIMVTHETSKKKITKLNVNFTNHTRLLLQQISNIRTHYCGLTCRPIGKLANTVGLHMLCKN